MSFAQGGLHFFLLVKKVLFCLSRIALEDVLSSRPASNRVKRKLKQALTCFGWMGKVQGCPFLPKYDHLFDHFSVRFSLVVLGWDFFPLKDRSGVACWCLHYCSLSTSFHHPPYIDYLEKTVDSLKRKLVKDADSHKSDNNRIMNENVVLIKYEFSILHTPACKLPLCIGYVLHRTHFEQSGKKAKKHCGNERCRVYCVGVIESLLWGIIATAATKPHLQGANCHTGIFAPGQYSQGTGCILDKHHSPSQQSFPTPPGTLLCSRRELAEVSKTG